jgi:uncharacterized protein YdaU (DUF1376 family)
MHYYQFNIGDYKTHTSHLTPLEDIAYRRLLDWYYLHEKPIPLNPVQAARLVMLNEYSTDVEQVLNEFFVRTEEGWINKRADLEIMAFKSKKENASKAGKASATARVNERSTDVQQTFNQPITINQEPLTNNQLKTSAAFALPDWIDKTMWDLWMKTRKGKKMIPAQMQAQVNKLEKWRSAGIDYAGALAASAENGWAGLFEPKTTRANGVQDARLEVARQIMGGQNGTDRSFIDINTSGSIEGDRASIPKIANGIWEPTVIEMAGD